MRITLPVGIVLAALSLCGQGAPPARAQDKSAQPADQLQSHLRALAGTDAKAKLAAVEALAGYGARAEPAVPGLIRALAVKDEYLRLNAAITLGKVGKAAAAPLAELLSDRDNDVRYYALSALAWVGPDA